MSGQHLSPGRDRPTQQISPTSDGPTPSPEPKRRRSISMHDGIAVWCDCCSCEAEPYWVEIAAEMGMDLGSDYEDGQ